MAAALEVTLELAFCYHCPLGHSAWVWSRTKELCEDLMRK